MFLTRVKNHLWAKLQFRASSCMFEAHNSDHYPIFTIVQCKPLRIAKLKYLRDHSENNLFKLLEKSDLGSKFSVRKELFGEGKQLISCERKLESYLEKIIENLLAIPSSLKHPFVELYRR